MVSHKPALHTLLTTETTEPRPQVNWPLLLPGGTRNLQAADLGTDLLLRETSATVCEVLVLERDTLSQSSRVEDNSRRRDRYRQERRVCFLAGVMLTTTLTCVRHLSCVTSQLTAHTDVQQWLVHLQTTHWHCTGVWSDIIISTWYPLSSVLWRDGEVGPAVTNHVIAQFVVSTVVVCTWLLSLLSLISDYIIKQ